MSSKVKLNKVNDQKAAASKNLRVKSNKRAQSKDQQANQNRDLSRYLNAKPQDKSALNMDLQQDLQQTFNLSSQISPIKNSASYSKNSMNQTNQSLIDQTGHNVNQRHEMTKYFSGWIDHFQTQKQKWQNLVKYRYLLQRLKLNKILWAWKLDIRQRKVNRLKSSIIQHQIYKMTLRGCLREWKRGHQRLINGLKILGRIGDRQVKRVLFKYMNYRKEDLWIKEHQLYLAQRYFIKHIQSKTLNNFQNFISINRQDTQNKKYAQNLYQKNLKHRYFRGLYDFSKMENKKLQTMKQVKYYLEQMSKQKILKALKSNYQHGQSSQLNLRKAMHFQIFRHKYFLTKQSFRVLKTYKALNYQQKLHQHRIILQHRLRHFFSIFLKGFKLIEVDEMTMIRQHQQQLMRLKFFSMWKNTLQNKCKENDLTNQALKKYDQALCQRILSSIKQVIHRKRELGQKSDRVKRNIEQRVMGLVLQRLSNVNQVREMRKQMLGKGLQNIVQNQKRRVFLKVKQFAYQFEREQNAENIGSQRMKVKVIKSLKIYMKSKMKQEIDNKMARKFRYLRLLQKMINLLKKFIQTQTQLRIKQQVAIQYSARKVIKQVWNNFAEINSASKYNQIKARKFFERKNKKLLQICYNLLSEYTLKRQDQNQKLAMASIKYQNHLKERVFSLFIEQISRQLTLNKQHTFKENRIVQLQQKHKKQNILFAMKSHRSQQSSLKNLQLNHEKKFNNLRKLKVFKLFKQFTQSSLLNRQKSQMAYFLYKKHAQKHLIQLLKQYRKQMRMKKLKAYKILKIWSQKQKHKVLLGLRAFQQFSREKKIIIEKAFQDRIKDQKIEVIMKLQRVGQYWKEKRENYDSNIESQISYGERKLKQMFIKWKFSNKLKNLNENIKTNQMQSMINQSAVRNVETSIQNQVNSNQLKNAVIQSQNDQVINWLTSFKPNNNNSRTPLSYTQVDKQPILIKAQNSQPQQALVDTKLETQSIHQLDLKKNTLEANHSLKLKEFDQFLNSITSKPTISSNISQINQQIYSSNTKIQTQNANTIFQAPPSTNQIFHENYQKQINSNINQNNDRSVRQNPQHSQHYQMYQNLDFNNSDKLIDTSLKQNNHHILQQSPQNNGFKQQFDSVYLKQQLSNMQQQIQQFVKDKELLRQLEQQNGFDSKMCQLMREDILAKSQGVQQMIMEVKVIKEQIYKSGIQ